MYRSSGIDEKFKKQVYQVFKDAQIILIMAYQEEVQINCKFGYV